MAKKYREVRKALREAGFAVSHVSGSHEQWVHADGRRTTLAGGGKNNQVISAGTLASIRRQTGSEDLR